MTTEMGLIVVALLFTVLALVIVLQDREIKQCKQDIVNILKTIDTLNNISELHSESVKHTSSSLDSHTKSILYMLDVIRDLHGIKTDGR